MINKLFSALALSVALATASPDPALAQTSRPPSAAHAGTKPGAATQPGASASAVAARTEALTTNMAQALSLTPGQIEKVRAINEKSVKNVEAARQQYRQDPARLRSYIEAVGLARLEQLKDVLTPNQFTRYQQKREEKMGIPTVQGSQGTPPPGLGGGRDGNE